MPSIQVSSKDILSKNYEPATFETEVYRFWESEGYFHAQDQNAPGQKSFSIVIPPPNVTGVLHMGHALTNTIQDILTRWHRMQGDNSLWLPGTDHAGIATQAQVEKAIRPKTRHELGREAFVARTWEWKEEHGKKITEQLRRMGSSLDWERERFTMDEGFSRAVREVFVRLHEEGLIYRGEKIINWCPRCHTALSDLEVIPTDRKGSIWQILYQVEGSDEKLTIATTRPETLLGDTAVAVHPEDERYKHLHGKNVRLPLLDRLIPIITDTYVDREFGTGALKVTPAHDFNDYDLGQRHQLPMISVMGKDGKITPAGGPYGGLKFAEARERVVQDLKEKGLHVKTEDHAHKVGLCQRCDQVAEPIISKQWFVKIKPLAEPAIAAVETGKITFTPKTWEKTYFEWMYNIRDWCISRQLWWGHQIPAWYCGICQEVTVAREVPSKCPKCAAPAKDLKQDEDVLDTWFSSALWPFGTLGWPEKTPALATFYPTSILETGFDIIFFWVARMIMMGIHFMGEVPFHKVYLHAMVRDEKGEKMSKSKGNVIDPLVIIDQHGADPLRFTLAVMAGQGRDVKLSLDRVEGYRGFCNKLWNATKFFFLQLELKQVEFPKDPEKWLLENRVQLLEVNQWILSRLQDLTRKVEKGLTDFELNDAAQALYDFTWHQFCDWFIEFSKLSLKNEETRDQTLITMYYVLERTFRLMHPFMPHVTEELWQALPKTALRDEAPALMKARFPKPVSAFQDVDAEHSVQAIQAVIDAFRNFRGEHNISPKVELPVRYLAGNPATSAFIRMNQGLISSLARVSSLEEVQGKAEAAPTDGLIYVNQPPVEFRISLKGLVNVEEESRRLQKEKEKTGADLEFVRNKLGKETFISKAPPELVAKERAREKELLDRIQELDAALKRLSGLA